jgi:glycosyltransferase involved in cell wall biosynthesis
MLLGIDASNIRAGGGVTHLTELLRAACPSDQGIRQIVVWGGQATLGKLPGRLWLHRVHDPLLDRSLPWRQAWQFGRLPGLAEAACDVLFTPGATPQHLRVPCVTVCQNMLPFEPAERRRFGWSLMGAKLHLLEHGQRRSFRQADGVIFLTRYAQRTVQQRIGSLQAQQAIIPHGIADEFRLAPRPVQPLRFYSAERPFRLVYVSIVSAYKHQWQVAAAVAQLRQAGLPVTLDLIGPSYGPALRRLEGVLQRVDPNHEFIRYVGSVDYQQLPTWYHRADAFVFASSCENLPIILLEAMAAGLPIACSSRGPMPEVLGPAGVYFDPENASDIATVLTALLTNQELRQKCAQLAFEQSRSFTWERCARETLKFIVDVANQANADAAS